MKHAFTLLAPNLRRLPALLRSAFAHPWVGSYQVGFGPPLVSASAELRTEVRAANGVLEKLDIYFRRCILDEPERRRLALLHRRLVVRRLGPVEAETLDETFADALDLRLCLRRAGDPPPDLDGPTWARLAPADPDTDHEGRFILRLDDPRGERLLHHESVAAAARDGEHDAALELRVAADTVDAWIAWLQDWARTSGHRWVELGRPLPHARQVEDGRSL